MAAGRLPNLLVVGVPKAGTGSLFAYLTQHPEICGSDEKEVGYFNYFNPLRHSGEPPPIETYAEHFAHCGPQRYRFEATPTYSYGGTPVIQAIQRVLPQPKVILALRDPVDRLWSAYTFQRELGNLTHLKTFEEYVAVCERTRREAADLVPRDHLHGLYIGFYSNYVGHWLDAFGADLRIVFTEQLAADPAPVMAAVFGWLGIDTDVLPQLDLARRNKTNYARSTRIAGVAYAVKRSADRRNLLPPAVRDRLRRVYQRVNSGRMSERLEPEVRRHLEDVYRPSNRETRDALLAHGYRDLPAWLGVVG